MEKSTISIGYRDFSPTLKRVEKFQKPILSSVQNQFLDYYVVSTSFFCDFQISTLFQPFSPYSPIMDDSAYLRSGSQSLTSFFRVGSKKNKSYFTYLFRFSVRFSRLYTIYSINRIINSLVTVDGVKRIVNHMFKFPQLKFYISQFQILRPSEFKLFKLNVRNISNFQIFDFNVVKGLRQNFVRHKKSKWPFFSVLERMIFKFFNTRRTKKSGGLAMFARMGILKVGYIFRYSLWKYISFNLAKILRRKLTKKFRYKYRFWIKQYYRVLRADTFSKRKTLGFIQREFKRRANIWWHVPRRIKWWEAIFKASLETKKLQNSLLQFFHPIPKNEIYVKIIHAYLGISNFNNLFTRYPIYFSQLRDSHQISKIYKIFTKLKPSFQYFRDRETQALEYIFSQIRNSFILSSNYQFSEIILNKILYPVNQTQVINIFKSLNRFFMLYYFGVKFRIPRSNSRFSLIATKLTNNINVRQRIISQDLFTAFLHLNNMLIFKNKKYKKFSYNSSNNNYLSKYNYIFQNKEYRKEFNTPLFLYIHYSFLNDNFKFLKDQQFAIYPVFKRNFYFGGETPWGYYTLLSSSSNVFI